MGRETFFVPSQLLGRVRVGLCSVNNCTLIRKDIHYQIFLTIVSDFFIPLFSDTVLEINALKHTIRQAF